MVGDSSFEKCRELERKSQIVIENLWRSRDPCCNIVPLVNRKEEITKMLQGLGDLAICSPWYLRGTIYVELKCEEDARYGNVFLETWSNKKRKRKGWMKTSKADKLFYHFYKDAFLLHINMESLQMWFAQNSHRFEEKLQWKHAQRNDTWGCPVPIKSLEKDGLILERVNVRSFTPGMA